MNIVPISFEVCWCAWNEPAGEDISQHSLTNCFLSDYQSNVEELSKTGRTLEGEADFRDHGTASECRASRSASLGVVWKYQASSENDLGFSLYWELQVICPYLPYLFVWLFLFYINWFDKYAEGPTCHKISIRVADMMFQVILCGNIYIYIQKRNGIHCIYISMHKWCRPPLYTWWRWSAGESCFQNPKTLHAVQVRFYYFAFFAQQRSERCWHASCFSRRFDTSLLGSWMCMAKFILVLAPGPFWSSQGALSSHHPLLHDMDINIYIFIYIWIYIYIHMYMNIYTHNLRLCFQVRKPSRYFGCLVGFNQTWEEFEKWM